MIEKNYGEYSLICEDCGTIEYFDTFDECIDYARRHGWKVYQNGWGEWEHKCPNCRKEAEAKEDFA